MTIDTQMSQYYPVLTIAGSDSSGGAGIQADIKSISAQGCYAMTAITAITAQNTTGVSAIAGLSPDMVAAQIDAVCTDITPLATKTGMLYDAEVIEAVADAAERHRIANIVVDPVMVSTSGSRLLADDAIETMTRRIFPIALIVTPNAAEAEVLTGSADIELQAKRLREMGCRNVLLKGGDKTDTPWQKTDWLLLEGSSKLLPLRADAVETNNTHGTGCSLSACMAARLALGDDLRTATGRAKAYVTRALQAGANVTTGHGHGPMNHFYDPKRQKIKRQEISECV